MEYRKDGTIKSEALDIGSERAEWYMAVIYEWQVQECDHDCRQRRIANANSLPVERKQHNRQKFHGVRKWRNRCVFLQRSFAVFRLG